MDCDGPNYYQRPYFPEWFRIDGDSKPMRYYVLLVLIACAATAVVSTLAALASAAAWPMIRRGTRDLAASTRARMIAAARLAPIAAGMLFAVIVSAAFIRYEPSDTAETPGILLIAAALFSVTLLVLAVFRSLRAARAGAVCAQLLQQCGRPIVRADGTRVWIVETPYPVAAVTGVFRTRLLLSTRILAECTADELEAVVRHEAAHVRRRDNLVRAAMLCLPDPFALLRAGREMQDAWAAAAEESADDAAAGEEAATRTVLAAALVRVARMATTPAPPWMPALAFFEGKNLENRVRRLLDSGRPGSGTPARAIAALLVVAALSAGALTETAARQLHGWMEFAVHLVP